MTLADATVHPSLGAADLERARRWYAEKLGLVPAVERPGVLVYRVGRSIFTVFESPHAGTAKNTVAAWNVADLRSEMSRLRARGVVFQDYDLEGLKTVDGVATNEDGALDAYFIDSEGNTIVLGQPAEPTPPQIFTILAASDLVRARAWYSEKLGLDPDPRFDGDELVYLAPERTLFVMYETTSAGTAKDTVAVWRVTGLRGVVDELRRRGVVFEDYDLGDARTVDGILDEDGDLTARFKDSEGNIHGLADDREPLF
jgi:catechol 2,3-dioxygenase-like lactoylglutathione lyase family enzyme